MPHKLPYLEMALSCLAVPIFGIVGLILDFTCSCWFPYNTSSCDAYSPLGMAFAYFLCLPLYLMQKFAPGDFAPIDQIFTTKGGWLALWLYYFVLISLGLNMARGVRRRRANSRNTARGSRHSVS
jgi:hypothetical protein